MYQENSKSLRVALKTRILGYAKLSNNFKLIFIYLSTDLLIVSMDLLHMYTERW
jgi:hypothetical protein